MIKKESINLDLLLSEIEYPFDGFEAREVLSEKEAQEELKIIEDGFNSSQWEKRVDALYSCIELLKGGIYYYKGGNLISFAKYIGDAINDLRLNLVKSAALLISAESQVLEDSFVPSLQILFPILLKRTSSDNSICTHICHMVLNEISKNCHSLIAANLFLSNSNSPNPIHRQIAIECCYIIREIWPNKLIQQLNHRLNNICTNLRKDPYRSINEIATSALSVEHREIPKKAKPPYVISLPYISFPTKSKLPKKSPKKSPRKEQIIQNYMPPSSQQEAQIFKDLLDSIVNESQFNKLNGRETVLIQSILIAIQKNPNFEEWENDLNVLMKQYPNEFRPFLIDILVQFEYDPQVFDLLAENYDIQEIAESFAKMKKPKVEIAFNFFVSLFSQGRHPILITHEIQSLLETLIRTNKHNKDCYILEDELEQINSPLELDELILTLEDILLNGLQWQEDFDLLLQYIDNSTDNIRLIQSSIDETFPEIITQSENKINIIKFIMELNKNCKEISFASCVEPILKCVDDDNLIIDCISQCMNNPNVMGVSINLIEKSTEKTMVLMEAVYKYLWGAPPQHLALLAKIIYNKFSKFLSNEDTNIRRLVQQIFVVFRRKIPKEFDRYLKKLTPTQQHIICFRAAKKIQ